MNRIGKMRHRITFQELALTTDPTTGVQSEAWSDVGTVWASFRGLTARELQAAGARQSEATVEFEIRKPVFNVNTSLRIQFDGDTYDVEEALLDSTRQRFYRIKAKRGVTNG